MYTYINTIISTHHAYIYICTYQFYPGQLVHFLPFLISQRDVNFSVFPLFKVPRLIEFLHFYLLCLQSTLFHFPRSGFPISTLPLSQFSVDMIVHVSAWDMQMKQWRVGSVKAFFDIEGVGSG